MTTRLTPHYPTFTPAERFAQLLAAASREDWAEHTRLLAAAPRIAIQVPDSFPRAMAFREVLDRYRMEHLGLAALLCEARYLAAVTTEGIAARMTGVGVVFCQGDDPAGSGQGAATRRGGIKDGGGNGGRGHSARSVYGLQGDRWNPSKKNLEFHCSSRGFFLSMSPRQGCRMPSLRKINHCKDMRRSTHRLRVLAANRGVTSALHVLVLGA